MNCFLKEYGRKIYGRELVGKVSVSDKNISLILIELQKKGVLIYETSGNRKYYSLNFSNPLIVDYILLFEKLRKIEFLEKNKFLIDFLENIKGEIVCVFGSYAKNTQRKNSDIDILVVGGESSEKIIKEGKKYGIKTQIFGFSLNDFKSSFGKKSILFKEISSDHILIKGGEKFVKEAIKWIN